MLVVFVFIASNYSQKSIWAERYLIIALLPYLLLVSLATLELPDFVARTVFFVLITCWASLSSFLQSDSR